MIEKICKIISNKTAKFPLGFGEKCITWLNGWRMIGHRDGYGMNRWRRQVECNDNTLGIKTPTWSLRKKQEFSLHTHPDSTLTKKGDYSRGILCIICLWPNNRISSIDSWRTQTARFKRPLFEHRKPYSTTWEAVLPLALAICRTCGSDSGCSKWGQELIVLYPTIIIPQLAQLRFWKRKRHFSIIHCPIAFHIPTVPFIWFHSTWHALLYASC